MLEQQAKAAAAAASSAGPSSSQPGGSLQQEAQEAYDDEDEDEDDDDFDPDFEERPAKRSRRGQLAGMNLSPVICFFAGAMQSLMWKAKLILMAPWLSSDAGIPICTL